MLITADALATWAGTLLRAWGASQESADFIADTLVEANLRGVDSHGVLRLPTYYKRVQQGLVDLAAVPVVTKTAVAAARVDGRNAPGQIVARDATRTAIELAATAGIGAVGAFHSAHFGSAGYFARMMAAAGLLGVVCSTSEPAVVPYGGRAAFLGTNPLAIAAPADPHPVCLDMATSAVAWGKAYAAQARGEAIPPDWFTDADGNPTTDPAAARIALPAAGAKGYGLAFLIEILAGALTGAAMLDDIGNAYTDFDRPQNIGHLFVALDPKVFIGAEEFRARSNEIVDKAHRSPAAAADGEVLAPGEPEERIRASRLAHGIELPQSTVAELAPLSALHGLRFPQGEE